MQRVDPERWVDAVAAAMADGHDRLVAYMALEDVGLQCWLRLRDADGDDVVLAVEADAGVPSLIDLLPDVAWPEREAAEMFGVRFTGREIAPLLLAPGAPAVMRREVLLPARQTTPWPGEKDPGGTTPRRRTLPPGVAGGTR